MTKKRLGLSAGLAMLTSSVFAGTPTGTEILFDPTSFENVEIGTTVTYTHERSADAKIPIRALKDGLITVDRINEGDSAERTVVTMKNGKSRRELDHFPADRGNPIFVVFLESSVNSVTFATKGSPFYIRNRFKEAFSTGGELSNASIEWGDGTIDAKRILYRPFKGDRNAKKMGAAFENLTIQFTVSDDVPGQFLTMTTQAEVNETVFFVEEIRFETLEKGGN